MSNSSTGNIVVTSVLVDGVESDFSIKSKFDTTVVTPLLRSTLTYESVIKKQITIKYLKNCSPQRKSPKGFKHHGISPYDKRKK